MVSIIGFIVILVPLVVVHELGHFLFAKLFNVRADAFSIGFGPVLFSKKVGETDFRVSAIPLGGYVKLLGEDPTAELSEVDAKRALHRQAPWKRFFIFFGGPLFNFAWAVLVFMLMMAIGEPKLGTVVGRVLVDTPAAEAGFLSGDQITAIDGVDVKRADELNRELANKPNQVVLVKINREDQEQVLSVKTGSEEGFSQYGEQQQVGSIDGIIPNPRLTKVGISNPASPAGKLGLKTGDEIVAIDGQAVSDFETLSRVYQTTERIRDAVSLTIQPADGESRVVELVGPITGDLAKDFGIHSSELFISQVMADSPAKAAGIESGDRIVAVDGKSIESFFGLREAIQASGEAGEKTVVSVERNGEMLNIDLQPQVTEGRDPLLKKTKTYTIGIMPVPSMKDPVMLSESILNPFVLLYKGTERMIDLSARNLISIGKMIQGDVSVKSLGGPILIGKLAGDSLTKGFMDFLRMMAVLSIGLGVLNILPIPVLDGGHIVLLGIESIRGKPLSIKQIEVAQQVGLVLILMIMVVVMKNDISRLPIFN